MQEGGGNSLLPRDICELYSVSPSYGDFAHIVLNNILIINRYFGDDTTNKRIAIKNRDNYNNLQPIFGIVDHHIPLSYSKRYFAHITQKILKEEVMKTSAHKFRSIDDISHWVIRYWQLCVGYYDRRNPNIGRCYMIEEYLQDILFDLKSPKHSLICLNDPDYIQDFENAREQLLKGFEAKFPEKSSFEL